MNSLIEEAYDPESFRRMGHRLVDQLADDLHGVQEKRALDWTAPDDLQQLFLTGSPTGTGEDQVNRLFEKVLNHSIRLHHPNFMGHQISPAVPIAALAGLATDYLNNGMGVYEMGMAGTVMEREIIRRTSEQFGLPTDSDGILTSGGTLANLTALLTARRMQELEGHISANDYPHLSIMASDQSHYCIDRAAKIMGLGTDGLIKVPTDTSYRMRIDRLPQLYDEAIARGRKVIAVVGSACSTSTGSFDDLTGIAAFCQNRGLWFHADGAHGGALAFSQQHRVRLRGIDQANSVVLDFHKMLLTPAIISGLIFRDGNHGYETFRQDAQYLWKDTDREWFNLAKRTFECTKNMMSLKIYAILQTYGVELFEQYVNSQLKLTECFAELIRSRDHFELAVQPECNIVCFRYQPGSLDTTPLNCCNSNIRRRLVENGEFYIVQTVMDGDLWLRTTLSNPFTTKHHLEGLLDAIQTIAESIT